MFGSAKHGGVEYIVVCLGNPGEKYTTTRHNMGFLFGDYIADKLGFEFNKIKFKSNYNITQFAGKKVLFMKPQTFMNSSGEAVAEAASFYKIPSENVIVIVDDVNFDVGQMRIRRKGSYGGHNGIKSINEMLKTENYPRIKLGVGKKPHVDYEMIDFVLGNLPSDEMKKLPELFERTMGALELVLNGKFDDAMQRYNS